MKILNKVWNKVFIKKDFENEPMYNNKHSKTKVKFYQNITKVDFHDNKIPSDKFLFIAHTKILVG